MMECGQRLGQISLPMMNGEKLPVYVLQGADFQQQFVSFSPILWSNHLDLLKVISPQTMIEAATAAVNPETEPKIRLTVEQIAGLWRSDVGEDRHSKAGKVSDAGKRLPPTTKPIKKVSALAQLRMIRKEARSRSRNRTAASKVIKVTNPTPVQVPKAFAPLAIQSSVAASPKASQTTAFKCYTGLASRHRLLLADHLLDLWDAYTDSHYMHVTMNSFQEGQMKHCRIDVEASFTVEGGDLTWDKARSVAVWQALLRLDGALCEEWLNLHPTAATNYPFMSRHR